MSRVEKKSRRSRIVEPPCDRCSKIKKRCDRRLPCSRCLGSNSECSYKMMPWISSYNNLYEKVRNVVDKNSGKNELFKPILDELEEALATSDSNVTTSLENREEKLAQVISCNTYDASSESSMSLDFITYVSDPVYRCPITTIPEAHIGLELSKAYFHHHHIAYPFLDKVEWYQIFDKSYRNGAYLTRHELFKIYMVLVIGGCFDRHRGNGCNISQLKIETLYKSAMNIPYSASSYPDQPDPRYIERILLTTGYSYFSYKPSNSIWYLIGLACRHVVALGYHRAQPLSISNKDAEMRSRIFWSAYNADRLVSTTLGLPFAIHDGDVSVDMPSVMSENFEPMPIIANGVISDSAQTRLLIGYRKLEGIIFSSVYRVNEKMEEEKLHEMLHSLRSKVEEWHSQTQEIFDNASEFVNRKYSRPREHYQLQYNKLLQLVYRPSPIMPTVLPRYASILLEATKRSTRLVHLLIQEKKVNMNWTYIYFLLNDAIVLVQSCFSSEDDCGCVHYLNLCINSLDQWEPEWIRAHEASAVLRKVVRCLTEKNSIDASINITNLSSDLLGYGSSYLLSNWSWNNLDMLTDSLVGWLDSVVDDKLPSEA